jgi:hypothetical protein
MSFDRICLRWNPKTGRVLGRHIADWTFAEQFMDNTLIVNFYTIIFVFEAAIYIDDSLGQLVAVLIIRSQL